MFNMIDALINELVTKLGSQISASSPVDNEQIKSILQAGLQQLDLVSREEFDAQALVLERTRLQLDELSTKVTELENQLLVEG